MTDKTLLMQTKDLVRKERTLIKQILINLKEIESRRLYLKRGYSSLFTYCTRALGYSESAAQRRIDAMRAISVVPEIAEKLESGDLTLSSVSLVQKTIRQEQKKSGSLIQEAKRKELFKSVENKSRRESEQVLIKEFPLDMEVLKTDKTRSLTDTHSEIKFVASSDLMEKLELIKHKFSHKNSSPTYNELFQMMAEQILRTPQSRTVKTPTSKGKHVKDPYKGKIIPHCKTSSQRKAPSPGKAYPLCKAPSSGNTSLLEKFSEADGACVSYEPSEAVGAFISYELSEVDRGFVSNELSGEDEVFVSHQPSGTIKSPSKPRRYIAAQIKRAVYLRDANRCQYLDPVTERVCGSKHLLQIDHRIPVSLGGSSCFENLQLLCAPHNQLKGASVS